VCYLVLFSLVDSKTFFLVIAAGAALSFFYCWWTLDEPEDAFSEEIEEEVHVQPVGALG
jgi:NNP family nitrate/nitrite transporter-like MFS transporter